MSGMGRRRLPGMALFETRPLPAVWIRRTVLTNNRHLYLPTTPPVLSKPLPVEFMVKTGKTGQNGVCGILFAYQCHLLIVILRKSCDFTARFAQGAKYAEGLFFCFPVRGRKTTSNLSLREKCGDLIFLMCFPSARITIYCSPPSQQETINSGVYAYLRSLRLERSGR